MQNFIEIQCRTLELLSLGGSTPLPPRLDSGMESPRLYRVKKLSLFKDKKTIFCLLNIGCFISFQAP